MELVINYDFPQDAPAYIHRIGRTGRAGCTGRAVTFFTENDAPKLREIVQVPWRLDGWVIFIYIYSFFSVFI